MLLDSIALSLVSYEIKKQIIPSKIVALYQLGKYEILLVLKNNEVNKKLFFSIRPDRMAFFLSEQDLKLENFPSLFFNQLKKSIHGGKLLNIEQENFDRIIKLTIQPYLKFGSPKEYSFIIEFMGKHSNAILIDEQGYIKASLKQIGSDLNRYREIRPGILYKSPPKQDKINPLTVSKEKFISILTETTGNSKEEVYLWQFFFKNFTGISIKSAKEMVAFLNFPAQQTLSNLPQEKWAELWEGFVNFRQNLVNHKLSPKIIIDKNTGKVIDYSLIYPINQANLSYLAFEQTSSGLEFFFNHLDEEEKKQELYQTINRILNRNRKKLEKKRIYLAGKNREITDCIQYKKKGELIKANLWNIKPGSRNITLPDYSSPGQPEISIELNPDLSPLQNASNYFTKYKNLQKNQEMVKKQILENQESLQQLNILFLKLTESKNSLKDLSALYQKLVQLNYIKKKKEISIKGKGITTQKPSITKFLSPDGWTILVGKNNKQNEYLLRHLSSGNDFWLHNLSKPGGHVIIKNHQNLASPPAITLDIAAKLAGYYSKTKNNENTLVIYTLRKYVKKPKNSKLGKVIYTHEKMIPVTINHEEIRKEIARMILT
jgi:predicted ribosome quality control (RQC) complex YloA/Tae2 family protein